MNCQSYKLIRELFCCVEIKSSEINCFHIQLIMLYNTNGSSFTASRCWRPFYFWPQVEKSRMQYKNSTSRSRVKQGEDYYWKHRPCSRTGSTPRCTRYFYAKGRCFQSHLREARHVTFFRSADKTQRADATIATILTKKHRAVVVRMCFVSIHIFKLQRACASDN